ncbi:MAG: hypothetical protein M9939_12395 [Mesorhizobium sp.]|nr:hypothetical protein [Mesorhizobium sp.]MCO5161933.1 hypothetical protein [Mesorhizobium sp.]
MTRLAPLIGAFALTCSFAAVAQTPAQSLAPASAPTVEVVPDSSVPAQSAEITNCGPRDEIVAQLGTIFQEAPSGMGLIDPTAVVEVFVSESGTFTILASGTDGTSCILASGEGWDGAILAAGRDT